VSQGVSVAAEYRSLQRKTLLIFFGSLAAGGVLAFMGGMTMVWIGIAAATAGALWAGTILRCPACGSHNVDGEEVLINPKRCPNCEAILE
jgi:hypothetical protein